MICMLVRADGRREDKNLLDYNLYREPVVSAVALSPDIDATAVTYGVKDFLLQGFMYDSRPILCEQPMWGPVLEAVHDSLIADYVWNETKDIDAARAALLVIASERHGLLLDECIRIDVLHNTHQHRLVVSQLFVTPAQETR